MPTHYWASRCGVFTHLVPHYCRRMFVARWSQLSAEASQRQTPVPHESTTVSLLFPALNSVWLKKPRREVGRERDRILQRLAYLYFLSAVLNLLFPHARESLSSARRGRQRSSLNSRPLYSIEQGWWLCKKAQAMLPGSKGEFVSGACLWGWRGGPHSGIFLQQSSMHRISKKSSCANNNNNLAKVSFSLRSRTWDSWLAESDICPASVYRPLLCFLFGLPQYRRPRRMQAAASGSVGCLEEESARRHIAHLQQLSLCVYTCMWALLLLAPSGC